jgi:hypothetical protein
MSNKEQLQVNNMTLEEVEQFMLNQGASLVTRLDAHIANKNNPHNITAVQIGAVSVGVAAASVE